MGEQSECKIRTRKFMTNRLLFRKQMIVDATQKPQREAIPINRGDLSRFIK